jgi:hypothetical protein
MSSFPDLRKSHYVRWLYCPKAFEYMYFQQKETETSLAMSKGTAFHEAAKRMLDQADVEMLKILQKHEVQPYLRKLLPSGSDLDSWFDWFAEFESVRFNYLRDIAPEQWKPVATEVEVTTTYEGIRLLGHIDRIDQVRSEKALCVTEYKTGRLDLKKLRKETCFYAFIVNHENLFGKPVNWWCVINPREKTYHIERFTTFSQRGFQSSLSKLVKAIKSSGPFERNITPLCVQCSYVNDCLFKNGEAYIGRVVDDTREESDSEED